MARSDESGISRAPLIPNEDTWVRSLSRVNTHWLRRLSPPRSARLIAGALASVGRGGTRLDGSPKIGWQAGLVAGGSMVVGRRSGRGLAELELHYSRHVREGKWWTPVRRPAHLMKILSLFDLADALDEAGERWRQTAVDVTYRFVHEVPEAGDMGYPYSPSHGAVLVDVLAMVPPVLARCGAVVGDGTLVGAAGRHLLTFANTNVDRETGLPFHGFYPNGPRYLGMLGWGRGVGWYLLGFALTIPSMPIGPTRTALVEAFEAGVKAAMRFQRDDGMWSDALLHARGASADSSATALIGWAIATGVRGGFLGDWARQSVLRARTAMKARTDRWGRVTGASGECGGLGRYSGVVGHFPWGQGPALAFAASETP